MIRRPLRCVRATAIVAVWAAALPAVLGVYAFHDARGNWRASTATLTTTGRPQTPLTAIATSPPSVTSAVALASYVVEHEHLSRPAAIVTAGNRLLAGAPSGYRLSDTLSSHRVTLRRYHRYYVICGRNTATGSGVICAATVLPVNGQTVTWAGGANLRQALAYARVALRRSYPASTVPSVVTMAGMGIDWVSAIGSGDAPAELAGLLLLLVVAAAVGSRASGRRRSSFVPAAAWVAALVGTDLVLRWCLRPHGHVLHLISGTGAFNLALGGSVLHRSMPVWGDEGRTASILLALVCLVSLATAWRLGHRILFFATCLAATGTLTNTAEKLVHGYATDYLWLGSVVHTTPFNLGDVYEFAGFVLVALCAARLLADRRVATTGHRMRAPQDAGGAAATAPAR